MERAKRGDAPIEASATRAGIDLLDKIGEALGFPVFDDPYWHRLVDAVEAEASRSTLLAAARDEGCGGKHHSAEDCRAYFDQTLEKVRDEAEAECVARGHLTADDLASESPPWDDADGYVDNIYGDASESDDLEKIRQEGRQEAVREIEANIRADDGDFSGYGAEWMRQRILNHHLDVARHGGPDHETPMFDEQGLPNSMRFSRVRSSDPEPAPRCDDRFYPENQRVYFRCDLDADHPGQHTYHGTGLRWGAVPALQATGEPPFGWHNDGDECIGPHCINMEHDEAAGATNEGDEGIE